MGDDDVMQDLAREECLRLLRSTQLGRIAIVSAGRPEILPVNYAVGESAVVFRTTEKGVLEGASRTPAAFEVDGFDEGSHEAWSVMVRGSLEDVTDALDRLSADLRHLTVSPMAPGDRHAWMALTIDEVSGRRFPLAPLTSS